MPMTEQEVKDFLAQFEEAPKRMSEWPQWMQDAAYEAAATFPKLGTDGIETRTYPDGTTATGPAPLPALSPALQGLLERALSFAEEVWNGKLRKDDREGTAFNLRCAIREYLAHGVTEAPAPDLLRRCLDTISALLGDMEGQGSRTQIDDDLLPDLQARQRELAAALGVGGTEAADWKDEAALVMAQFVHLSATPDRDRWAETASRAIRLLNDPAAGVKEPHACRWFNGRCMDCGRAYGEPRADGVKVVDSPSERSGGTHET